MKQFAWLALAGLLTMGCGADTTLPPTEDHAAPWVGEYEGTGDFWLSNGVEGTGQPIAINIAKVDPKHITVTARLTFGSGRNDFVEELRHEILSQLAEVGVTGFVQGTRYATADQFAQQIEPAVEILDRIT